MIVATQNIYYQNRMFKAKEPLPCYDKKMVEAWLKSGAAIDTDKGVAKATPTASVNTEPKEELTKQNVESPKAEVKEEKRVFNVKTRSKK